MPNPKGPTKFGVFLYPGFEVLDVFGPLEALNTFSRKAFASLSSRGRKPTSGDHGYLENVECNFIAAEKGLVTPAVGEQQGASIGQKFEVCYSIHDKLDLDVLLIPGGLGSHLVTNQENVISWLRELFPKLKYLITVCTGAEIAATAGLLDGLCATTNKQAWDSIPPNFPKTYWVAKARWVQSSTKIWTTSGVSAGTDGFIAWIKKVYGEEYGDLCCQSMEYRADTEAWNDSFGALLKDVPNKQ